MEQGEDYRGVTGEIRSRFRSTTVEEFANPTDSEMSKVLREDSAFVDGGGMHVSKGGGFALFEDECTITGKRVVTEVFGRVGDTYSRITLPPVSVTSYVDRGPLPRRDARREYTQSKGTSESEPCLSNSGHWSLVNNFLPLPLPLPRCFCLVLFCIKIFCLFDRPAPPSGELGL